MVERDFRRYENIDRGLSKLPYPGEMIAGKGCYTGDPLKYLIESYKTAEKALSDYDRVLRPIKPHIESGDVDALRDVMEHLAPENRVKMRSYLFIRYREIADRIDAP